jgi:SpoVK/Ycf46/Vps4 family AAA+-type ATPase
MNDVDSLVLPAFFPLDEHLELIAQHIFDSASQREISLEPLQLEWLPPELTDLQLMFNLTSFECHVLLLCHLPKLNARLASLMSVLNFNEQQRQPTPSVALRLVSVDPHADRRALTSTAPLFRYGLVVMDGEETGEPQLLLTPRAERWLSDPQAHAMGQTRWSDIDVLLRRAMLEEVAPALTGAQERALEAMRESWMTASMDSARVNAPHERLQRGRLTASIHGGDAESRRALAAMACDQLGWRLHTLPFEDEDALGQPNALLGATRQYDPVAAWVYALNREAQLNNTAFLLELNLPSAVTLARVEEILERCEALVLLSSREPLELKFARFQSFEMPFVRRDDQPELWVQALEGKAKTIFSKFDINWRDLLEVLLNRVFDLANSNASMIARATDKALHRFRSAYGTLTELEDNSAQQEAMAQFLWEAVKEQTRVKYDAQKLLVRMESSGQQPMLVLSDESRIAYDNMIAEIKLARAVRLEKSIPGDRGHGIVALFTGPSGTGKTTLAQVLGQHFDLDVYRIDLSQVQSKYIGETSKHFASIFEVAQIGCAVIVFDEADSVFGKRSPVQSSNDRYANSDVNYLLQTVETLQGIAVLTTNLESSIDEAFQRRLRFTIRFELPTKLERSQIWDHLLPPLYHPNHNAYTNLNLEHLAQIATTGGLIRNIYLHAVYLAKRRREPIQMIDIFHAAKSELHNKGVSWEWAWFHGWDLPEDVQNSIPDDAYFDLLGNEVSEAFTDLLKAQGVPRVTHEEITKDFLASVVGSTVNCDLIGTRRRNQMQRQDVKADVKTEKYRLDYFEFIFEFTVLAKENAERRKLFNKVLRTFTRLNVIPERYVPSAEGMFMKVTEGDEDARQRARQVASQRGVSSGVGQVWVVELTLKSTLKV